MMIAIVLLSVVTLLLVIAVIGLFAMMGELSARTEDPTSEAGRIEQIDSSRAGAQIDSWPANLSHLREGDATFLVFSSTCASCTRILSGETGPLPSGQRTGMIVVSASESQGRKFISQYDLAAQFPLFVDYEGQWTRENLGIESSPSIVTVKNGRVESAAVFTAASALQSLLV